MFQWQNVCPRHTELQGNKEIQSVLQQSRILLKQLCLWKKGGKCFREQLTKSIIVCQPFGHSMSVITFFPTRRHSLPSLPSETFKGPYSITLSAQRQGSLGDAQSCLSGLGWFLTVQWQGIFFISHPVCRRNREMKGNKNPHFEKGEMGNTVTVVHRNIQGPPPAVGEAFLAAC